jgi:hypothetical protein
MFHSELLGVLKQVVSSWEVIAVTIVVLLYWSVVNSITNGSKSPKAAAAVKRKKVKRRVEKPGLGKNVDTSGIGIED